MEICAIYILGDKMKDPGVKLVDVDKAFTYLYHIKSTFDLDIGPRHLLNAKRICLGLRRHPHLLEDKLLAKAGL